MGVPTRKVFCSTHLTRAFHLSSNITSIQIRLTSGSLLQTSISPGLPSLVTTYFFLPTPLSSFLHPNSSNNEPSANFVSSKKYLFGPCPPSLQKAIHSTNPDHDTWLKSYNEEKQGLECLDVFECIKKDLPSFTSLWLHWQSAAIHVGLSQARQGWKPQMSQDLYHCTWQLQRLILHKFTNNHHLDGAIVKTVGVFTTDKANSMMRHMFHHNRGYMYASVISHPI